MQQSTSPLRLKIMRYLLRTCDKEVYENHEILRVVFHETIITNILFAYHTVKLSYQENFCTNRNFEEQNLLYASKSQNP